MIIEDRNFHITYRNKQAEQIFGWKSEEVLGKRIVDLMVHNEDHPRIPQMLEDFSKGISLKQPNENRNYTKYGKVLFCQWYHSLLRDGEGNVETVLSIVRNITVVRTKEETLQ